MSKTIKNVDTEKYFKLKHNVQDLYIQNPRKVILNAN